MNIQEMIEQLTEMAEELGPNIEVRIAYQPNYPLQASISNITAVNPYQDDLDELNQFYSECETDEEREDMMYRLNKLEDLAASSDIVYLCEGSPQGYASRNLWN